MKKLLLVLIALWLTTSVEAQWVQSYNKPVKTFLKSSGSKIYMGSTPGVHRSTNDGVSWVRVDRDSIPFSVNSIIYTINGVSLLAGTSNGVYKSTNDSTWTKVGLNGKDVLSLYYASAVWAGTTNGLYKSTDDGASWSSIAQLPGLRINDIWDNQLATNQGLYRTTNNGAVWFVDSIVGSTYNCNYVKWWGGLVVGHSTGFLINRTGTWFNQQIGKSTCFTQLNSSDRALVGSDTWGVVLLYWYNGTLQTKVVNQGIPTTQITALQGWENQAYVFAGTSQNVYRAPQAYVPVEQISSEVPSKYVLLQNYPNPFNNQTEIVYTIKNKSHVRLNVYDVVGKLVVKLVNEVHSPGTYSVSWNANEFSSGTYFYEISTSEYKETKRMVLTK